MAEASIRLKSEGFLLIEDSKFWASARAGTSRAVRSCRRYESGGKTDLSRNDHLPSAQRKPDTAEAGEHKDPG